MQLIVPAPILAQTGVVPFEKPLEVRADGVVFSDGTAFVRKHLGVAGFFTYRQAHAGAALEIWDRGASAWRADPGGVPVGLAPDPFANIDHHWTFPLVPAAGAAKFAVGAGYPRYAFRAYFETTDHDGTSVRALSGATAFVSFTSLIGPIGAGLDLGANGTPVSADEVRVFLGGPGIGATVGQVWIRRMGSTAQIEIVNFDPAGIENAAIRLMPDGSIHLRPKTGLPVAITGNLTVTGTVNGTTIP